MTGDAKNTWYCRKINELKNGMYAIALSILRNEADAEDAIQNALIISYQHLDELRFMEKFKPWLFKILTNECYKLLNRRENNLGIDDIDTFNCSPDKKEDFETKLTLWNAVNQMELNYRTVIILFYYENMSIRDIAKALDISADNVKQRLSRARNKLKSLLYQEDFYE